MTADEQNDSTSRWQQHVEGMAQNSSGSVDAPHAPSRARALVPALCLDSFTLDNAQTPEAQSVASLSAGLHSTQRHSTQQETLSTATSLLVHAPHGNVRNTTDAQEESEAGCMSSTAAGASGGGTEAHRSHLVTTLCIPCCDQQHSKLTSATARTAGAGGDYSSTGESSNLSGLTGAADSVGAALHAAMVAAHAASCVARSGSSSSTRSDRGSNSSSNSESDAAANSCAGRDDRSRARSSAMHGCDSVTVGLEQQELSVHHTGWTEDDSPKAADMRYLQKCPSLRQQSSYRSSRRASCCSKHSDGQASTTNSHRSGGSCDARYVSS